MAAAQKNKQQIAILMLNMGGPGKLEEVGPFLNRLFTDTDIMKLPFQSKLGPYIAKRRTSAIQKKYGEIGGGSPILKWTNLQGEKLVEELNKNCSNYGIFKHYVGFRYAYPLTEDAIEKIKADGIKRIIAFSQYPQYSCSTAGSSLNKIAEIMIKDKTTDLKWSFIDRWPVNEGLVQAFKEQIEIELAKFNNSKDVVLLFSAHSLPLSVVNTGDTYPSEVGSTVIQVMNSLKISNPYRLVYQSKVGPVKWLEPQTDDAIKSFAKNGHKKFLIIPISFVNEHIETLHELDIEYAKELGEELGVEIGRVPSPNDHPSFIRGMANLVKDHLDSNTSFGGQLLTRCPKCPRDSCKNAREWLKSISW